MNTPSLAPYLSFNNPKKTARIFAFVLGAISLASTVVAAPITVGYSAGNTSASTTPGVKYTVPTITDPNQTAWQLTSFTWLSTASTGALNTGRGFISIFDAALFDPVGKTASDVNSATTGLIGRATGYSYDAISGIGTYTFSSAVNLQSGKSYYFLNSAAVSTSQSNPAPYNYGFTSSGSVSDISRLVVSSGTWANGAGAPNFSAVLTAVPEPTTSALFGPTAVFGFAAFALILRKRRSLHS